MILIILGILILLAAVWMAIGLIAFRFGCGRRLPGSVDIDELNVTLEAEAFLDYNARGEAFAASHPWEDVWLRHENHWLHGYWFDSRTDRTAICVHGYTGHGCDRFATAAMYAERGFSVLLPDLRGHGQSEGRWIGMGTHDSRDLNAWVEWVHENTATEQKLLLDGISMGGATVLACAGLHPRGVRMILDDCGFTSAWDEFSYVLSGMIKWCPGWGVQLVMTAANLWSRWLSGNDLHFPSALEGVKQTQVPILFIHGTKDDFVPYKMVHTLYEACPTEKLLLTPEATHGTSYMVAAKDYEAALDSMIEKYM